MFVLAQYMIPFVLLALTCSAGNAGIGIKQNEYYNITGETSFRDDYQYDEEHKYWFKLHINGETWEDANNTCNQEGAILASPIDKGLVKVYRTLANKNGIVRTFVGLHRGEWRSVEGFPLSTVEENIFGFNFDHSSPCAVLNYGHLLSANCSEQNAFVCYKRDVEATNAAACDTARTGYVWKKETGHCYKFHKNADTWKQALGTCISENAYLTVINSEDEANVIQQIFNNNKNTSINSEDKPHAHVGFINYDHNSEWYTIDGQLLKNSGYQKWDENEPNQTGGKEFCGSIAENGRLNDNDCDRKAVFICEKNVENKI